MRWHIRKNGEFWIAWSSGLHPQTKQCFFFDMARLWVWYSIQEITERKTRNDS